jgi:hypothetical protein
MWADTGLTRDRRAVTDGRVASDANECSNDDIGQAASSAAPSSPSQEAAG